MAGNGPGGYRHGARLPRRADRGRPGLSATRPPRSADFVRHRPAAPLRAHKGLQQFSQARDLAVLHASGTYERRLLVERVLHADFGGATPGHTHRPSYGPLVASRAAGRARMVGAVSQLGARTDRRLLPHQRRFGCGSAVGHGGPDSADPRERAGALAPLRTPGPLPSWSGRRLGWETRSVAERGAHPALLPGGPRAFQPRAGAERGVARSRGGLTRDAGRSRVSGCCTYGLVCGDLRPHGRPRRPVALPRPIRVRAGAVAGRKTVVERALRRI